MIRKVRDVQCIKNLKNSCKKIKVYSLDLKMKRNMKKMRGIEKKISEISSWDLDKGCRKFINQSTPKMRRLKKIVRKNDRKRLDKTMNTWYNDYNK